ncbi:LysR family transcriptional regulator [uncultured Ferrovibrio sp.]|jgi:Transcriptional regulator|uniref:LysR family transcriptional regulator n=1 Tax=uncultured Ferrovibrio sp. TaxID=1576913 RepID=UPI002624EB16|nr:LysR family transcriptional regulator [uncultured Ferrovibrio sp.]
MDLDDMRCFVDVLESGGFNLAAKRLGISKSVVSRRISKIEAELGARLLSRTTNGMSPTEAGFEFKARCERILAEFDMAREVVAQHGAEVVGRLRISAPQSFGVRHVTPVLADMAKRHPKLEIDVSFSDRSVDLISEGFDAAIRIGSLQDSSLVARRIAPVRSALVASPGYLAQRGRPSTPTDLTNHDCLIYSGRNGTDWKFRSGGRWVSVRPSGRLRADSGETIVEWAVAGLGIADVPTFLLNDQFESGALEPLLLDYSTEDYGIFVVRPPGSHVPGKVRVLIESLVERFGGEPHWDRCLMQMAT